MRHPVEGGVTAVAVAWALLACFSCARPAASPPESQARPAPEVESPEGLRPNVIFIMADDLGYECIGANGGTSYATPRIDRMAGEGLRFTRAYTTPLCTPSRVQLMTGRYSYRNYERFGYLNPGERTFANELRDAGYDTCMVGKWQLTYGDIDPARPKHFGFDEWTLWNSRKTPGARYADPVLDRNGEAVTRIGDYGPAVVLDHALEFIGRERSAPFLLYYPMILPHAPFVSTPRSEPGLKGQAAYAAMVEYVDHAVGEVLDRVDALGNGRDTLVLFTGDNGTPRSITSRWNGASVPGGKALHNERGMHVPLVARWSGVVSAGVTDALVDSSDVLPTLLELAGAERARPEQPIDGVSFGGVLLGKQYGARRWSLCHYDPRWNVPGRPGRAVFDGRYRLYGDGRLLDLLDDPVEGTPVAADDAGGAEARGRLGKVLDALPAWEPPPKAGAPKRR